ncbi:MAG TPA: phosphoribosyltransferase family protein [Anaerolineae bacterium]|nr:phosphoribosyltransferase family protein [Anaerolineae bacterium]
MFLDRVEAGRQLADVLSDLRDQPDPLVVLAIPRGGVIVAREVARALHAPIDICLTHKIGAPGNPELAIGAIADDGTTVLDQMLIHALQVPHQYLEAEAQYWKIELARRAEAYRGGRARVQVKDCVALVIDDGVATGSTLIAALRSTRAAGAKILIAAVPVGPRDTIEHVLSQEADRVECLLAPDDFYAVGTHYRHFAQVSDEQVIEAMTNDQ